MFSFERFMGVLKNMFITVLGQKEASPRVMEHGRSLRFVLLLFQNLSRLVFPNRGMRGELVGKAR